MATPVELAERLYAAVLEDDPGPFLDLCSPDAVIATLRADGHFSHTTP